MSVDPPIPDNEARQAVEALAGYSYQLYQTLSAWLALERGEALFVEVAEDYATATSNRVTATQIRATAANITLNSSCVTEALNAFWKLKNNNPARTVTYRYVTTSSVGKERGVSFPDDAPGLIHWRDAARPGSNLSAIRSAILTLSLDEELRTFVSASCDEEMRDQLLSAIHWDCGEHNLHALREKVELQTAARAKTVAEATVAEGKRLTGVLIAHLLRLATNRDTRQILAIELDEIIEQHLLIPVSRRQYAAMLRARSGDEYEIAGTATVSPNAIPLPDPLLERHSLISELADELNSAGSLYLQASSGMGKSTAARLIARQVSGSWVHVDFYKLNLTQTTSRLIICAIEAAQNKSSYILDDLPVEFDAGLETPLAVLANAIRENDKLIVITTRAKPSSRLRSASARSTASLREMPNLSLEEVSSLISSLGGDPAVWAAVTLAACGGGHPQLVVARLRRLATEKWPKTELLGGIAPSRPAAEIQDERFATRRRLFFELDEPSRTLITRLSAIGGSFDRALAFALAAIQPPLKSCGDLLTQLIGPWIEQREGGYLRLSPLLEGSADEHLGREERKVISEAIVDDIIQRRPVVGELIPTVLAHALSTTHIFGLAWLASLPLRTRDDRKRYACEQLFGLQLLRTDKPILNDHPELSVLLRLAQFQVAVALDSFEVAHSVAHRLFEDIDLVQTSGMRSELRVLAIQEVYGEPRLPSNPTDWFNVVLSFDQQLHDAAGTIADDIRRISEEFRNHTGLTLSQFLFSVGAARTSSIAELEELFANLSGLSPDRRSLLLSSLDGQIADYNLAVQHSWFGDHKKNAIDGYDAARRFKQLANIARSWNSTALAVECEVARVVMLDEYASSPSDALNAIDEAESEDGPHLSLTQARAKVLYRAGDHEGSLAAIATISDHLPADNYLDRAFSYRAAGISAAELSRFSDSRRYFADARHAARRGGDDLQAMSVGLLADLAVIDLRLSNKTAVLADLKEALIEIERIGLPRTDSQRYVRQMIGHAITWITREMFPQRVSADFGNLAYGKCSQPEIVHSVVNRPLYPIELCWYQLASLEQHCDVDAGVRSTIETWPDTRRLLGMEILSTNDTLGSAIRRRSLTDFETALVIHVSALRLLSEDGARLLRIMDAQNVRTGRIESRSLADCDAEGSAAVESGIVGFALSCVCSDDLEAYSALLNLAGPVGASLEFKRLVPHLRGTVSEQPDAIQQLCGHLHRISQQRDSVVPSNLFVAQCQLLAWLTRSSLIVELGDLVSDWIATTWTRIIRDKTFMLRRPLSSVPPIAAAIELPRTRGLSKAADVLLAAEEASSVELAADFRQLLDSIRGRQL